MPPNIDRLENTLGFIDQTIYANEHSSDAVTWTNAEVLELLRDIRKMLTEDPALPVPTERPTNG